MANFIFHQILLPSQMKLPLYLQLFINISSLYLSWFRDYHCHFSELNHQNSHILLVYIIDLNQKILNTLEFASLLFSVPHYFTYSFLISRYHQCLHNNYLNIYGLQNFKASIYCQNPILVRLGNSIHFTHSI